MPKQETLGLRALQVVRHRMLASDARQHPVSGLSLSCTNAPALQSRRQQRSEIARPLDLVTGELLAQPGLEGLITLLLQLRLILCARRILLQDFDQVVAEVSLDWFAHLADGQREGSLFERSNHAPLTKPAQVATICART